MNYYDQIDPQGKEDYNECAHCGNYTTKTYCSRECKKYDTE